MTQHLFECTSLLFVVVKNWSNGSHIFYIYSLKFKYLSKYSNMSGIDSDIYEKKQHSNILSIM